MIVEHIGITVNNLERSMEFYTKVFGFQLLRKTPTSAYLFLGSDLIELMQSRGPHEVVQPKNAEEWNKKMFTPPGLSHIGFRVDDLDKTIEKLERLGGKLVVPPWKFKPEIEYVANPTEDKLKRAAQPPKTKPWWRIASFSDPDGTILELVER